MRFMVERPLMRWPRMFNRQGATYNVRCLFLAGLCLEAQRCARVRNKPDMAVHFSAKQHKFELAAARATGAVPPAALATRQEA